MLLIEARATTSYYRKATGGILHVSFQWDNGTVESRLTPEVPVTLIVGVEDVEDAVFVAEEVCALCVLVTEDWWL